MKQTSFPNVLHIRNQFRVKTSSLIIIFAFILGGYNTPVTAQDKMISADSASNLLSTGAMLYQINDSLTFLYQRPVPFSFVPHAALDIWYGTKKSFARDNLINMAALTVGTIALIIVDQEIIDGAQQFGRYIEVAETNNQKNISPLSSAPVYVPTDLPSGLYYIGDGMTEIAVNGGFYLYGLITHDKRALTTASELSEGLVAMGITTQVLKHLTGRQCPFTETQARGRWNWLPNQFEYSKGVPHYDAFPSGHLATAMMTVTIISSNYPEKWFIKPIGYTLMTLCGLQMLNNGVHWASDYPMAIALGYSFGKMAVKRNRYIVSDPENLHASASSYGYRKQQVIQSIEVKPAYLGFGNVGLGISLKW
jgi:hypothetical protein